MFCKNCGNNIADGQVFCPVCGTRAEEAAAPADNAGFQPASNGFSAPSDLGENDGAFGGQVNEVPSQEPAFQQAQPSYEAPAQQPVMQQQAPQEAYQNVESPAFHSEQQDSANFGTYPDFVGGVAPAPVPVKKKSNKMKIIFSSIAIVLVITIVAGVIFWDDIAFKFASDEERFQTVQSGSVEKLAGSVAGTVGVVEDFSELLTALGNGGQISKDNFFMGMNGAGIVVSLGEDLKSEMAGDAAFAIDWLDSAGINGELVVDTNAVGINYGVSLNSVDIATAQCAIETESGDVYFTSPEVFEKSIKVENVVDMSELSGVARELEPVMQMFAAMPDEKVIESLIVAYTNCVVSSLDGVKEGSETVQVNGVSQKQTVYTVKINEDDIINICKAVLKKAQNDEKFKKVLIDLVKVSLSAGYEGGDEDMYEDTIKEFEENYDMGIEQAIMMLSSPQIREELPEFDIDFKLYAMDREATGFSISAEDFEFSYKNVESGSKVATEFMIETPDGGFGFSGNGTKKGGKVDGTYAISFDDGSIGGDLVQITTKALDTEKLFEGDLVGTINIAFGEDVKMMGSMLGDLANFVDYNISLTGKAEGKNGHSFDVSLNNGDELYVGLKITTKKDKNQKVNIPKEGEYVVIEDEYDFEEVAQSIANFDGLFDKLEEAGLPSMFVNYMEEEVERAMGY
ncbi:MAG: zinc-ribbon domain-containing protein [Clostridia bacterium]|nr:zinc-ribbon domain-containing protein [Clostridia bacterium]